MQMIESFPIYGDLEDIWQSIDGKHAYFIAREYLKHSSWSEQQRIDLLEYCYLSLDIAHTLVAGELNIQELLTLLKFFKGHVYPCSHMELKMSYTLGVKIKGSYILMEEDVVDLMVKLDELILASTIGGTLLDHPEDYTSGLFLF